MGVRLSRTPAVAHAQSAKALYKSNRVAATTRAFCGKQCLAAAPFSSTLRRRRLRRLRRLGRHQLSPPLPHTAAAARRCTRLVPVPTILQTAAAR